MKTTPQYLLENVSKYTNEPALSIKDKEGNWKTDSWNDFYDLILNIY